MRAAKYTEEAKYLLRMDAEDKRGYEAAALTDHLSLADWINLHLRKELRRRQAQAAAEIVTRHLKKR